jgi:hypothetical protein
LNCLADIRHNFFRFADSLAPFYTDITGNRRGAGIYFPHPALQEGCLSRLPWRVEYPVQLISDIPVQLGAQQAIRRREHIVIIRVAGAGGVKTGQSFLTIFA